MVPNSSEIKSPQKESKNPATQSNRDAPTDPTDSRMVDGVENIPVPIIRPILDENSVRKPAEGSGGRGGYMSIVQLNTPKWHPIPPAVSSINGFVSKTMERREYGPTRRTFLERQLPGSTSGIASESSPATTLSPELPKSLSLSRRVTPRETFKTPTSGE